MSDELARDQARDQAPAVQGLHQWVTSLCEAVNAHDAGRVITFYSPDYEGYDVSESGPLNHREGARQNIVRYLQAFPDLHLRVVDLIIQGQNVAITWSARATHRGLFMNIPPTGQSLETHGVLVLTVRDGLIIRATNYWDVAGFLRAIGLLPEL